MKNSYSFLPDGPELIFQPLAQMEDRLAARKTQWIDCEAGLCRITQDDQRFVFCDEKGKVAWPMRKTFFEKLVRWHKVPPAPLYKMAPEFLVPFLNGILKLIRGPVRIFVEDGEALTIASERYSPVSDLDLLKRFKHHPVSGVSRTDFHMRIYFAEHTRFEPVAGDPCGLGYHVFNSETGFMALLACTFILRYSCGNGAVRAYNFSDAAAPLYHYNITEERIESYLVTAQQEIEKNLPLLKALLTHAVKISAPSKGQIARELNGLLGYRNGADLLEDFVEGPSRTLYDLFNHITEKAKFSDANRKVLLEKYAGNILSY